jgi:hypothetical protein
VFLSYRFEKGNSLKIHVISREAPGAAFGEQEALEIEVRHSEDSNWTSQVWRVSFLPANIAPAMELGVAKVRAVTRTNVWHTGNLKPYLAQGLAYCLDQPPVVNPDRVVVWYQALYGEKAYWIRPTCGEGGWFSPRNNVDRFVGSLAEATRLQQLRAPNA